MGDFFYSNLSLLVSQRHGELYMTRTLYCFIVFSISPLLALDILRQETQCFIGRTEEAQVWSWLQLGVKMQNKRGLTWSWHGSFQLQMPFPSQLTLNKSSVKHAWGATILYRVSTLVWKKTCWGRNGISTELEFHAVPSGNLKLNQTDWSSYLSYKL